mgnify:CR=1 FL=1
MDKALSLEIKGIKCDTEGCDFKDMSVEVEDYKDWLNKPCPKCGGNLLTQADFDKVSYLIRTAELINKTYPKPKKDELIISMKINMDGSGKIAFDITDIKKVD